MYNTDALWLMYSLGQYVIEPRDVKIDELTGSHEIVIINICNSIIRAEGQSSDVDYDCDFD